MKSKQLLGLFVVLLFSLTLARAEKAGTVFSYSGRLSERAGSKPANGEFEMTFQLFDAETKGSAVSILVFKSPVVVSNGVFGIEIDFGLLPFITDDARYMEIAVRPLGVEAPFEIFPKRQRLNVVPYSIWAGAAYLAVSASEANSLLLRADGQIKVQGAGVGTATTIYIHKADVANLQGHVTVLDNPHCNNNPGAILFVTHNWTADSAQDRYERNPVGVYYNGNRWTIFHEDITPMPIGRAFNVMIVKP